MEHGDPPSLVGLNAVSRLPGGEAVLGGIYGFTGTYTPSTGALVADPVATDVDIHAIWRDSAGGCWAVGGRFSAPYRGAALRRTVTYFIPTADAVPGPMEITARLRFRPIPPYLLRIAGLDEAIPRLPIDDLATASATIEVR